MNKWHSAGRETNVTHNVWLSGRDNTAPWFSHILLVVFEDSVAGCNPLASGSQLGYQAQIAMSGLQVEPELEPEPPVWDQSVEDGVYVAGAPSAEPPRF